MLEPDVQPERLRRFRRAVWELDFLETVCIAALERAIETDKYLNQLSWAYNPNVDKYEHNVALANKILDDAGYKRGSDGARFHLKFVHAASYAKAAEVLRDQLRQAGIAVDLQMMDFAAAVDVVYIKKDFDLGLRLISKNGPDPVIGVKRTVVSSNIAPVPFSNGAGYRNPRVDDLFTLAASELDRQKTRRLLLRSAVNSRKGPSLLLALRIEFSGCVQKWIAGHVYVERKIEHLFWAGCLVDQRPLRARSGFSTLTSRTLPNNFPRCTDNYRDPPDSSETKAAALPYGAVARPSAMAR